MSTGIPVFTAVEAAALDAAMIEAGTPSRALMQRAGAAAAGEIARRFADRVRHGVVVCAGGGNNGGDGWVVARALAAAGVRVTVVEGGEPRTADARFERESALPQVRTVAHVRDAPFAPLLVDALLGTGAGGAPRGAVVDVVRRIMQARDAGARVVALDIPTGVDATTGEVHDPHVVADVTLTFGSAKQGLLRARSACGEIVVLDIGLSYDAASHPRTTLVTAPWVAHRVAPLSADAHKGSRRKVAILGGAAGMAGAATLAARAAFRSGVGMVRALVAPASLAAMQASTAEALAGAWPAGSGAAATVRELVCDWADALLIGPGLSTDPGIREMVEVALTEWRGPVVLDADALNIFAGDADALRDLLAGRPAIVTPHLMEFVRLSGAERRAVMARPFDAAHEFAARLGCTVLLKGVPTVIASAERRLVSASGTPALATAGSGDLLAGIAITLLAQLERADEAGACAAWVHGRAAELAGEGRGARGVTLPDVLDALGRAWPSGDERPVYPVLAQLPAVDG